MKRFLAVCLFVASLHAAFGQKTAFSPDSALADLRVIVKEIGPRPMGSPAEQRGHAFAVEKFRAYGCDTAYIMPMTDASGVNTTSGIAVGIHKGKTGRIILIGGHMDSAGPDIPGANDDGSGAACVIELARVFAKRPTESTIVFCCWGGEERGLEGSKYFVDHFAALDSIALMIQLDMADGATHLLLDPDGEHQVSAPHWLVDAALDIFYHDLNDEGLVYEAQSATINATMAGTGSDHMPFIEHGIPSICFTSDVNYPIHTPLDNWENFTPSGLAKSGEMTLKLVERFDAGVPSRTTDEYWLMLIGTIPLYLSHPLITAFIVLSLLLAIAAYVVSRQRRPAAVGTDRIKWSSVKVVLFVLVIQAIMWLAPDIIAVLRGIRFPWANNFDLFIVYGLLLGLVGVWLTVRWSRVLRLTPDSHGFALRALLLLAILTGLLTWANVELGLYGAASLFCVALSMFAGPALLRYALVALAVVPIFRLAFIEELGLYLRSLANRPHDSVWQEPVFTLVFVLFFTLLSLPFAFSFAAVYRATGSRFLSSAFVRGYGSLAAAVVLIVGWSLILLNRPVYNPKWEPEIKVVERYTVGADSSTLLVSSGEWLEGTVVRFNGKDSTLRSGTSWSVRDVRLPPVSWCSITSTDSLIDQPADSLKHFLRRVTIHSAMRPLGVTLTLRSKTPFTVESPWSTRRRAMMSFGGDHAESKAFEWYSFPDTLLTIPITFAVRDSQKVNENIDVTFPSVACPLDVVNERSYMTKRTVVHREESILAPVHRTEFAEKQR